MANRNVKNRRRLPELREFFIRNRVPLAVLRELLRSKSQRKYLGIYEELARQLNQYRDKKEARYGSRDHEKRKV